MGGIGGPGGHRGGASHGIAQCSVNFNFMQVCSTAYTHNTGRAQMAWKALEASEAVLHCRCNFL